MLFVSDSGCANPTLRSSGPRGVNKRSYSEHQLITYRNLGPALSTLICVGSLNRRHPCSDWTRIAFLALSPTRYASGSGRNSRAACSADSNLFAWLCAFTRENRSVPIGNPIRLQIENKEDRRGDLSTRHATCRTNPRVTVSVVN